MTVASGLGPDAGALVPQQQGDGLELRAHGRRHPAAPGRRLDLTGSSGEHRDDVAAVLDALLLPRGGAASARLALAWSRHRLLLWNAGARWPRQHAARPAAGDVPDTGLVLRTTSADLRIFKDQRSETPPSVSRGP
jgi:hypothetical protein